YLLYSLTATYAQLLLFLFFLAATPTTEIYTLSLHDALPIYPARAELADEFVHARIAPHVGEQPLQQSRWFHRAAVFGAELVGEQDRKSTRLNSSHVKISYAVFCLKKKKNNNK